MRKLWFLGCLNVLGVAFGQAPTSCIQDTLVIAPGATPVQLGTIQISWPQFNYGIYTVAPGQLTYTVNNGLVGGSVTPLCLVPTDHSSSFVAYSAHITTGPGVQAVQTYWKIPTNGGPFTLNQVTVNYTPGLNVNINPTQLTTVGGAAGYALTLNSSLIPTWLPEAGGITYCPAGVCNSTGSAWGTSYAVGTGANDLVQLNGSAQLPAVSAALLTNFPNVPTATQLNSACPANQYTDGQTCTQPVDPIGSQPVQNSYVTLNPNSQNGAGTSPSLGFTEGTLAIGAIRFTTGSSPHVGNNVFQITFPNAYPTNLFCILYPNSNSAISYWQNSSTFGFVQVLTASNGSFIMESNSSLALSANTSYLINWSCVGN